MDKYTSAFKDSIQT